MIVLPSTSLLASELTKRQCARSISVPNAWFQVQSQSNLTSPSIWRQRGFSGIRNSLWQSYKPNEGELKSTLIPILNKSIPSDTSWDDDGGQTTRSKENEAQVQWRFLHIHGVFNPPSYSEFLALNVLLPIQGPWRVRLPQGLEDTLFSS